MKINWVMRTAILIAVCLSMLIVSTPALAIWEWCEMDPELVIDGHTITLQALVERESTEVAEAVHGITWFRVYVPRGIDAAVVSTEDRVKAKIFKDKDLAVDGAGAVPVKVALTVNTQDIYPLCLRVSVDGEIVGEIFGDTSNTLTAQFILP